MLCSYAVGERYLALLRSSHADPRRIARAALNQAQTSVHVGAPKGGLRAVNAPLAQLPPGGEKVPLRLALMAQRDALAR